MSATRTLAPTAPRRLRRSPPPTSTLARTASLSDGRPRPASTENARAGIVADGRQSLRPSPRCLPRPRSRYFHESPPQPHCSRCGRFLPWKADRVEPWEDTLSCDGSETVYQHAYTEEAVGILGEEYRGKTYPVSVSECGIEVGPHEPHVEIMAAGAVEYRTCGGCGHENQEAN